MIAVVRPRPVRMAVALALAKPPRLPVRARMLSATSKETAPPINEPEPLPVNLFPRRGRYFLAHCVLADSWQRDGQKQAFCRTQQRRAHRRR